MTNSESSIVKKWEGGVCMLTRNKRKWYVGEIRLPSTVAGFIVLATGIIVLLKGVWMTSPIQLLTWGIILGVGMLLILIGTVSISLKE